MNYLIRTIEEKDNAAVEAVIRACLIEFGGNREGLAWCDADLGRLSRVYCRPGSRYWVVEAGGTLAGGGGIGPLPGADGVCELQKMYFLPAARGTGAAQALLMLALAFAKEEGYTQCYLETLQNMTAANKFYLKHGFAPLSAPLLPTEHYACDAWYLKKL